MQEPGKIAAAIEILDGFAARKVPIKTVLQDWARNNRFAGAKDRAWISGLCMDALRQQSSLKSHMNDESARALALGALRFIWDYETDELAEFCACEPHGPGALSDAERARLAAPLEPSAAQATDQDWVYANYPQWLEPNIARRFGADARQAMAAYATRAPVDLRINSLKSTPEKSLKALKPVKGTETEFSQWSARIAPPPANERGGAVTVIPAFNKGWVEVQDLGSQIAAAAAGRVKGKQVLDFCAGGGGKTLALAALMENTGQLFAFDIDARRMKPIFHRAKRAGVRNLQICAPTGRGAEALNVLDDLHAKMDVVFVDAPCTGTGTWRRHPDTKWRLTPQQLERRQSEQQQVLASAAHFVKPGGRLVYVTCSFLCEENEDQISDFVNDHPAFCVSPVVEAFKASGWLSAAGLAQCTELQTDQGFVRLSPHQTHTDGFFIATLTHQGANT